MLLACAPHVPLLKKLNSDGVSRITLITERLPFRYTSALSASAVPQTPAVGDNVLLGVAASRRYASVERNNTALASRAEAAGIATNHRQIFLDALVAQLRQKGISVSLVELPFESALNRAVGRDEFQPVHSSLPKDLQQPAFYLNFDAGTCDAAAMSACVRAVFNPVENTAKAAVRIAYAEVFEEGGGAAPVTPQPGGADSGALRRFDAALSTLDKAAAARLVQRLEAGQAILKPQASKMFMGDR